MFLLLYLKLSQTKALKSSVPALATYASLDISVGLKICNKNYMFFSASFSTKNIISLIFLIDSSTKSTISQKDPLMPLTIICAKYFDDSAKVATACFEVRDRHLLIRIKMYSSTVQLCEIWSYFLTFRISSPCDSLLGLLDTFYNFYTSTN